MVYTDNPDVIDIKSDGGEENPKYYIYGKNEGTARVILKTALDYTRISNEQYCSYYYYEVNVGNGCVEYTKTSIEHPHYHDYNYDTSYFFRTSDGDTEAYTCNADMYAVDKCSCGLTKTRYVDNTGDHFKVKVDAVSPTCTSEGLTEGEVCAKCGFVFTAQSSVPKIAHDYEDERIIYDSTCYDVGQKIVVCKQCGEKATVEIEKKSHKWGNWEICNSPSCTEAGNYIRLCQVCGNPEYKPYPALGHKWVTIPAYEATTEHDGWSESIYCSICGYEKKASKYLPIKNVDNTPTYKNEWVNGKWYDKNGKQSYSGKLIWKSNSKGWWVEDTAGWYPQNKWQKIDGIWYFFKPDGYMASNEYYNGYWFNKDGSWDSEYYLTWKSNSTGWWVEDKSGWWPSSKWLKIDGDWYYFNASGYMATSQYVDGYWIGANGVCQ